MKKLSIEDQHFQRENYAEQGMSAGAYENCVFTGCHFSEADLSEVKFTDCRFEGCDLSMARLKDSISVDSKSGYRYSITKDDSTLVYKYKHRLSSPEEVKKRGNNYYHPLGKNRGETFVFDYDVIRLDERYKIAVNQRDATIEIWSIGNKRDYLLFTMVKGKDKIMIYNESYYGWKLEFEHNAFNLFQNSGILSQYKLLQ